MHDNKCVCNKFTVQQYTAKYDINHLLEIADKKCYLDNNIKLQHNIDLLLQLENIYNPAHKEVKTVVNGHYNYVTRLANSDRFLDLIIVSKIYTRKSLLEVLILVGITDLFKICDICIALQLYYLPNNIFPNCSEEHKKQHSDTYNLIKPHLDIINEYLIEKKYKPSVSQIFWMLYSMNDVKEQEKMVTGFNLQITQDFVEQLFNPNKISLRNEYTITLSFHYGLIERFDITNILMFCLNYKINITEQIIINIIIITAHSGRCGNNVETNIKELITYYEKNTQHHAAKDLTNVFNLLYNFGYKITFEQAILCTYLNTNITNIEDYGININQEIFHEIISSHCYDLYKNKLNMSLIILKNKLKHKLGIAEIKKITKLIKPDKECLLNSLKNNSLSVVQHIIQEGKLTLDIEVLKKAIDNGATGSVTRYIAETIYPYYKDIKIPSVYDKKTVQVDVDTIDTINTKDTEDTINTEDTEESEDNSQGAKSKIGRINIGDKKRNNK